MSRVPHVVLLIDADNVSSDVVEQAFAKVMAAHGAIHTRRAYCSADYAAANLKLLKALSIRPMVNVSAGKNCTDIALAVDAMELVMTERPDVVVLVSSDSDFAPLVARLREKGCRVEGIGQEGKTADESKGVYDQFDDLSHRKARGSTRAASTAAVSKPAAKRSPRAKTPRAEAARPAPPAPPPLPIDVVKILDAIPSLRSGDKQALNTAAELLRSADLLGKRASSTKLFHKYPEYFVLSPDKQPNQVQFRADRR